MTQTAPNLLGQFGYTKKDLDGLAAKPWLATPASTAARLSHGLWWSVPHLEHLSNKLTEMRDRPIRLIVTMPPRHGKSEIGSHYTPVWFLENFPDRRIILASYEASFARSWGRKARNTIGANRDILSVRVASDSSAAADWNIEGHPGGMITAGVGGAITGRGAHCLPAGTLIATNLGLIPIERLQFHPSSYKILSYDAARSELQWKAAQAFSVRPATGLYRVRTSSGRVVEATGGHRFWTSSGYKETSRLAPGDTLLRLVPQDIRAASLPDAKAIGQRASRRVLFGSMLTGTSRSQESSPLQGVRRAHLAKNNGLLHSLPPTAARSQGRALRCDEAVSYVQHGLSGSLARQDSQEIRDLLFKSVRRTGSLSPYVWPAQPEGDALCSLPSPDSWRVGIQAVEDTVAVVERLHGAASVYDIQVADNQNFFANGILVHNCLIIDDPVKNAQDAASEIFRESAWDWWRTVARTRLEPGGSVVIIMTRWHEDDLAGKLLAQDLELGEDAENWEVINFPAISEEEDVLGRQVGEALWPERYGLDYLSKTRIQSGVYWWSAMYQQRPTPAEGGLIKLAWLHMRERPQKVNRVVQYWDTAFKEGQDNDYSVCCTMAEYDQGYIVLEIFRRRLEYPDLIKMMIAQATKWRPQRIRVEDAASGQSAIQTLRRTTKLPIVPRRVDRDKVSRINAQTGYMEAGLLHIWDGQDWNHDFLEELSRFPTGVHDDQVDALEGAFDDLLHAGIDMGSETIDTLALERDDRPNPLGLDLDDPRYHDTDEEDEEE